MILRATVERVCFPKEGAEGDWYIIETNMGTVKGKMRWRPEVGELLAMEGKWGEFRGQKEFNFKEGWHDLPDNPRDMLHYACDRTKGVGQSMEQAIWEIKKCEWASVKSGEIPRMTDEILSRFQDTVSMLKVEHEKATAVSWLMSMGATRNMGESAFEQFREGTIGVVQNNPYRLADVPHYSFKYVDENMRRRFGIGDHDERRVRSAIVYFMRQLCESSTVTPWFMLRNKVINSTSLPVHLVSDCVAKLMQEGAIKPFTGTQMLSLAKDFQDEMTIYNFAAFA
jgi:exodeoxyribonuclease V alpha subunit